MVLSGLMSNEQVAPLLSKLAGSEKCTEGLLSNQQQIESKFNPGPQRKYNFSYISYKSIGIRMSLLAKEVRFSMPQTMATKISHKV